MNKTTEKPTAQDGFESIWSDYQYPSTDMTGNISWMLSQDIQNEQTIQCMEIAEQFVEKVAKSADLPFVFDKTMKGTVLKKQNQLGTLFYQLLRLQNGLLVNADGANWGFIPPANFKIQYSDKRHSYEISENVKILNSAASGMDLNRANFTGHPMSKLTADGLLEGELINSFAIRLREAAKQKRFKAKLAERKKEPTQSFTKTKRYIDRLYANNPALLGVRLVICYENQYLNPIMLSKSHGHLMRFLQEIKTGLEGYSPVGWWWKREYMTEVGYRYYLILFFDGNKILNNPTDIQAVFGEHWRSVTKNQGTSFIPQIPNRDYERCGTRCLQGYDSLDLQMSSIQRMLMRDIFLRLEPNPKSAHLGMGTMPKLIDDGTPINKYFWASQASGSVGTWRLARSPM